MHGDALSTSIHTNDSQQLFRIISFSSIDSLIVPTTNERGKRGGIGPAVATIIVVLIVCALGLGIVEMQTSSSSGGQKSPNAAQVEVTGTALLAANFLSGGTTKTFTCATTSAGSYLTLTNTGSGRFSVSTISFAWEGGNTAYAGPTSCNIGAQGSATATIYLLFPATSTISPSAISGQRYTGTVSLSNGAQLLFTGTWQ